MAQQLTAGPSPALKDFSVENQPQSNKSNATIKLLNPLEMHNAQNSKMKTPLQYPRYFVGVNNSPEGSELAAPRRAGIGNTSTVPKRDS